MKTNASIQNQIFEEFINLYSLQKTLRFELKPIGKTKETLQKWLKEIEQQEKDKESHNILLKDKIRAADYQLVKKIIDEYHKEFIEKTLSNWKKEEIETINQELQKVNEPFDKESENPQKKLRKIISSKLTKNKEYKELFGKELFGSKKDKGLLEQFIEREDIQQKLITLLGGGESINLDTIKKMLEHFKQFTVYFKGYNENRKNLYSDEEKFSTIPL